MCGRETRQHAFGWQAQDDAAGWGGRDGVSGWAGSVRVRQERDGVGEQASEQDARQREGERRCGQMRSWARDEAVCVQACVWVYG